MSSIKKMQEEIRTALTDAFASVWTTSTKYAVICIEHCNDNNHSPDLVLFMAEELRTHGNGGGVYLESFINAVKLTTARTIKWDKEKGAYTSTFDREVWDKLQAEEFKFLAQLKNDGLGSFKPKRGPTGAGKGKNSAVTKGEAAILAKDIAAEVEEIKKLDPDNAEVQAIVDQLKAALIKLQDTKKTLLSSKKIMDKLKPTDADNVTSQDDEVRKAEERAARKAQLEAELEELTAV